MTRVPPPSSVPISSVPACRSTMRATIAGVKAAVWYPTTEAEAVLSESGWATASTYLRVLRITFAAWPVIDGNSGAAPNSAVATVP